MYINELECLESQVMANSAEKVRLAGNSNVMVCERGTMFGYSKSKLEINQMPFIILVKYKKNDIPKFCNVCQYLFH